MAIGLPGRPPGALPRPFRRRHPRRDWLCRVRHALADRDRWVGWARVGAGPGGACGQWNTAWKASWGGEPLYRLEPERAPASELAAVYLERWEIETAFDELMTHLRGAWVVLRGKTPQLVKREFHGLLLAHYATRKLMHEAAVEAGLDPDCLSFLHAVRGVRLRLPPFVMTAPSQRAALRESVLEEILGEPVDSSRGRRNSRAVKRKMSSYPLKRSQPQLPPIPDIAEHIRIVK